LFILAVNGSLDISKPIQMKIYLFSLLLFTCTFQAVAQTGTMEQVIGKTFVSRRLHEIEAFKNYKEMAGYAIEPLGTDQCLNVISNGKKTVVLFTKYIAPKSYKILAVLDAGVIGKTSRMEMGQCRINTKKNGKIVALVTNTNTQYFKKVVKAWRADEETHKFISIPIKGIDCWNEEYGNDEGGE
jgi:hypothetical protein